jgi:hypothetical protein
VSRHRVFALLFAAGLITLVATPSCDEATPFGTACSKPSDCVLPYVCCNDSVLNDLDPGAPATRCVEPLACPHPGAFLVEGNPCRRGGAPRYEGDDPNQLGLCSGGLICCLGTLTCGKEGACPPAKPPTVSTHAPCTADDECSDAEVCCGINAFARHGSCTSVADCGGIPSGGGGAGGAGGSGGAAGMSGAAGSPGCSTPAAPTPTGPCDVVAEAGLVMHLRFDEDAGATACDASGAGNKGVVDGGTSRVPGKFATGIAPGSLGVRVANSPTLNPGTGLTVEAWIKTATLLGTGTIVARGSVTGAGFVFGTNDGTLTIQWGDGTTQLGTASSSKPIQPGAWHHVAVVQDGTKTQLYADGLVVGETNGPMFPLTSDLYVGTRETATAVFNGVIDDVKWWNVARAQVEVCADGGGTYSMECGCKLP